MPATRLDLSEENPQTRAALMDALINVIRTAADVQALRTGVGHVLGVTFARTMHVTWEPPDVIAVRVTPPGWSQPVDAVVQNVPPPRRKGRPVSWRGSVVEMLTALASDVDLPRC